MAQVSIGKWGLTFHQEVMDTTKNDKNEQSGDTSLPSSPGFDFLYHNSKAPIQDLPPQSGFFHFSYSLCAWLMAGPLIKNCTPGWP